MTFARTVHWWPVHEYLAGLAGKFGHDLTDPVPYIGTLGWLELADDDPLKKAAVLLAADHHVLRLESDQIALAEASKAVAGAADWPGLAREIHARAAFRATHPWARRIGGAA